MQTHIVFWFLANAKQLADVPATKVFNLMLRQCVQVTPYLHRAFDEYYVMSARLRPPDPSLWKQIGIDIVGITAGMEDMFPFDDIMNAISTGRVYERRSRLLSDPEELTREQRARYGLKRTSTEPGSAGVDPVRPSDDHTV